MPRVVIGHFISVLEEYRIPDSFSQTLPVLLTQREGSTMDVMDTIRDQIQSNDIILYMKGSPDAPQCGFSARTVQCLMDCGEKFAFVDVLSNPEIRANLPKYGNWPTFPQLWVKGELIGGCDIVTEMYQKGELQPLIKEATTKV